MENSFLTKTNILEATSYIPGRSKIGSNLDDDIDQNFINLSSNTNILGPSPKVIEAIKKEITKIQHYPDPDAKNFKEIISTKLNIDIGNILVGNGSAELIDVTNRALIKEGDEIILGYPTFPKYEISAKVHSANINSIPMLNYEHNLDKISSSISKTTKVIYLDNPSNPVGSVKSKKEILNFIDKIPDGTILVIDEAYLEFYDPKNQLNYSKLVKKENILIMRTLSKAYGIAGLRIGYLIGNSNLISYLNKVREVFNVNSLALVGGIAAIKDEDHLMENLVLTHHQKKYLCKNLEQHNFCFHKSTTNFIFINTERDIEFVDKFLLKQGIIIRPIRLNNCKSGHIRVTIGKPAENKYLIESLLKMKKAIPVIN